MQGSHYEVTNTMAELRKLINQLANGDEKSAVHNAFRVATDTLPSPLRDGNELKPRRD